MSDDLKIFSSPELKDNDTIGDDRGGIVGFSTPWPPHPVRHPVRRSFMRRWKPLAKVEAFSGGDFDISTLRLLVRQSFWRIRLLPAVPEAGCFEPSVYSLGFN